MTWTRCAICGTLAVPANGLVHDGKVIVHRACRDAAIATAERGSVHVQPAPESAA